MYQIYHIFYKAHCAIKNIKETIDDVTLFVRSLINADDEADDTYSESEAEDGNADDLEEEYDNYKEYIFYDLEYDDSDSEEEEEKDDAIDFSNLSEKIYMLKKNGRRKSIITLQSALGYVLSILT